MLNVSLLGENSKVCYNLTATPEGDMAKHYKQDKKDRRDESRGMKRYEKEHDRRDDRHRERRRDSHEMMMPRDSTRSMDDDMQSYHEGKKYYGPGFGHIANMPPYADLGLYPKERKYLKTDDYPDTIQEIDNDDDFNYGKVASHRSKSMY